MKRVLPPFVYAVEAKGKTYHYFRKDGANVRVDPSAPDFWTTYADLKQARAPVPKTVTFGGVEGHGARSWARINLRLRGSVAIYGSKDWAFPGRQRGPGASGAPLFFSA